MEAEMKAKKLGTEKVRWSLARFFYTGINDPQLDEDVTKLVSMYRNFHSAHAGKLEKTLGLAMRDLVEMEMLGEKIGTYLSLLRSLEVANPAVKAKEAEINVLTSKEAGEYCEFFTIELAALSDEVLLKWYAKDTFVAKHRSWIEHTRIFKPHMLTEPVESALTKREPFGESSWGEFHEELSSDIEIRYRGKKKNLEEALDLMNSLQSDDERAKVMELVNEALGGYYAKYAAQTLWMVTGSCAVEDEERKYPHPMAYRNMSNRVSDGMVDALHDAVRDVASPLAKRFYRLKAKHLGLDVLRWSDKNAPIPLTSDVKIPFDEAKRMVLSAYQNFSPTLASRVHGMFKENRVDAHVVKGRADGAFCTWPVLPDKKPHAFVFLNYLGDMRDVMTLAHEVGHGVHGELAGFKQGTLMCDVPTAYAETASIFGEMTTFNFLKKRLLESKDKESLLALLMQKLSDSMNTMVRQIGFSNFERRIHGMDMASAIWQKPKKLSVEELNTVWLETIVELYGEAGEVFTYEDMDHFWTYVSHFHSPFYVYGYAFGELLTQSLYAAAPQYGARFESLYLDLLRSGSTKSVVELLAPFGLDPTSKGFWAHGIEVGIGAMLKEAEELSREMGIEL